MTHVCDVSSSNLAHSLLIHPNRPLCLFFGRQVQRLLVLGSAKEAGLYHVAEEPRENLRLDPRAEEYRLLPERPGHPPEPTALPADGASTLRGGREIRHRTGEGPSSPPLPSKETLF